MHEKQNKKNEKISYEEQTSLKKNEMQRITKCQIMIKMGDTRSDI